MLKAKLDQDIKKSLLAGDKTRATILRNLKSSILYAEVATNQREVGLDDKSILEVLAKESKKRQESADLYIKGGDQNRAQAELDEKAIIDEYLPEQLSDQELNELVEKACDSQQEISLQSMGKIIAEVKQQAAGRADGARIAKAVKERLQ
jgi:uncharacterized protein